MKGFKFLNPYGATEYNDKETIYPLPGQNDKWGPWFDHPQPSNPDGKDCGPGRWHVMKNLNAKYAPTDWWVWFADCEGVVGESLEKFGCTRIRLRRITRKTFWKIIRMGSCCEANLSGANLSGANLSGANLFVADLSRAIGYNNK